MDLHLCGKRAVVTGGSRGIGKAIANQLAKEGVDVAIVARGSVALEKTAIEIQKATGRNIVPIKADTGDVQSVKQMLVSVNELLGGVDILVNCAAKPGGQTRPPRLIEITEHHFWDDMNVKVMGYLRCSREVAPQMIKRGWGRIINVSGLAARGSGSTIGSMRNVAVSAMAKNLADELGPHGINVTVVHPGVTRTEATPNVVASRAQERSMEEVEIEREMAEGNSIGRLIAADEVADVVVFLASPRSTAINGDAIACGGGVGTAIHY